MLTRRVIPCLDIRDGRVVKGVKFQGLRDAGDPVERALAYQDQGADELCVLDVSATHEERAHGVEVIAAIRGGLGIPLLVGGGVRSLADATRLLLAGADKVAVNTAALERPALLTEIHDALGAQCCVVAVDAARLEDGDGWEVITHGGRRRTGVDAVAWCAAAVTAGAGEILLTSWDRDGTGEGYDLELLQAVSAATPVPIIASGGAAGARHLLEAFGAGADAVLAASIFHDGVHGIEDVKAELQAADMPMRITRATTDNTGVQS